MRTIVVSDPPPPDFEALMERRRRAGADRHDEVWEGVLHLAPAPHWRHADVQAQLLAVLHPLARAAGLRAVAEINVGEPDDYRVPDGALSEPGGGSCSTRPRGSSSRFCPQATRRGRGCPSARRTRSMKCS